MELEKAYHKMFWGYFLISFHINVGSIQIVPTFIGWLIIASGAALLKQLYTNNYFTYAFGLAVALVIISGLSFITDLQSSTDFDSFNWILVILIAEALFIYCLFQGFTGYYHNIKEEQKSNSCCEFVRRYLVLETILILLVLYWWVNYDLFFAIKSAVAAIIIRIFIMLRLGKNRWYEIP